MQGPVASRTKDLAGRSAGGAGEVGQARDRAGRTRPRASTFVDNTRAPSAEQPLQSRLTAFAAATYTPNIADVERPNE